jgi:4-alpha-glucanotransferase
VAWLHERSRAWQSLSGDERTALEKLFAQKDKQMEQAWEDHARSILGPLTETTAMIPCAEDLGVNLKCLPQVLSDLGILSLRVLRWARDWAKPGQPFQSLASYPPLSVTATSVHDSSTVREWWEREGGGKDMIAAFKPRKSLPPEEYTTECAAWLLETAASSKSVFCIHPIQDYLALVSAYRPADPQAERINIPGTVCPGNWTYRLPMDIAVLLADKDLQGKIQNIAEKHRR